MLSYERTLLRLLPTFLKNKRSYSHLDATRKFIEDTPLEKMLELAQERLQKKMTEPPKWVFPEDP
ncbi:hypothetical protein [Nostoc sp. ChiQUE01b]|uniref:hypothetical protein n=1 Tax=Nostoc sp. ChiQUE01b TaxID=3075376 RepID=UPI002AD4EE37|nr:hypothetical protein [Nostoc sp. ChiQUE01b]MDZ8260568.1 hypothetical protein [Nostoc sp. ChiQUE01b]